MPLSNLEYRAHPANPCIQFLFKQHKNSHESRIIIQVVVVSFTHLEKSARQMGNQFPKFLGEISAKSTT